MLCNKRLSCDERRAVRFIKQEVEFGSDFAPVSELDVQRHRFIMEGPVIDKSTDLSELPLGIRGDIRVLDRQ